jgi:RNase P protein component
VSFKSGRFEESAGSGHLFVGITASKKVGNAVARNRAKRRIRALIHEKMQGGLSHLQKRGRCRRTTYNSVAFISGRTVRSAMNRAPSVNTDRSQQFFGLGIVFIATKHTPVVEWRNLEMEFGRVLREGINQLEVFGRNAKTFSN